MLEVSDALSLVGHRAGLQCNMTIPDSIDASFSPLHPTPMVDIIWRIPTFGHDRLVPIHQRFETKSGVEEDKASTTLSECNNRTGVGPITPPTPRTHRSNHLLVGAGLGNQCLPSQRY